MLILIIVIVVLVALVGFGVIGFNKLRTSDVGAQEALGGIDVQLTRRADLIPNLVETVKGYAAHESGVFEEVARARAGVQAAAAGTDVPAKAAADAALQQALVKASATALTLTSACWRAASAAALAGTSSPAAAACTPARALATSSKTSASCEA